MRRRSIPKSAPAAACSADRTAARAAELAADHLRRAAAAHSVLNGRDHRYKLTGSPYPLLQFLELKRHFLLIFCDPEFLSRSF